MHSYRYGLTQYFNSIRQWRPNRVRTYIVALRNYKLLLSPEKYWDELAKLDWWLLMSEDATAMPTRMSAEHDKLMIFAELADLSRQHERLLNGFLEFGMLGRSRPDRPIKRSFDF
jgi:hypothetical protein